MKSSKINKNKMKSSKSNQIKISVMNESESKILYRVGWNSDPEFSNFQMS